jgi:hypothetical protein
MIPGSRPVRSLVLKRTQLGLGSIPYTFCESKFEGFYGFFGCKSGIDRSTRCGFGLITYTK